MSKKKFKWTHECEDIFQLLKNNMKILLPLAKLVPSDAQILYLSIHHVDVSPILVQEEAKGQALVYYLSKLF